MENFLGAGSFIVSAGGNRIALEPCGHRGSSGQRFPAAAESAGALRAGGVDDVMADFGMRAVGAAIEVAVDDDAAADAGADGDIDQSRFAFAGAPSGFAERGSVAIVFQRDLHIEFAG